MLAAVAISKAMTINMRLAPLLTAAHIAQPAPTLVKLA
jgi:hypothetical protein